MGIACETHCDLLAHNDSLVVFSAFSEMRTTRLVDRGKPLLLLSLRPIVDADRIGMAGTANRIFDNADELLTLLSVCGSGSCVCP